MSAEGALSFYGCVAFTLFTPFTSFTLFTSFTSFTPLLMRECVNGVNEADGYDRKQGLLWGIPCASALWVTPQAKACSGYASRPQSEAVLPREGNALGSP